MSSIRSSFCRINAIKCLLGFIGRPGFFCSCSIHQPSFGWILGTGVPEKRVGASANGDPQKIIIPKKSSGQISAGSSGASPSLPVFLISAPMRNGHRGQLVAGHLRTSARTPPQQSIHFSRIAFFRLRFSVGITYPPYCSADPAGCAALPHSM